MRSSALGRPIGLARNSCVDTNDIRESTAANNARRKALSKAPAAKLLASARPLLPIHKQTYVMTDTETGKSMENMTASHAQLGYRCHSCSPHHDAQQQGHQEPDLHIGAQTG